MLGEDEDTYSYEIWPTPETRTRLFWGIGKGATSAGVDTAIRTRVVMEGINDRLDFN